jgi:hypothetical protein
LLSNGWLVMRFALEQVTNEPFSCCKAIAQEPYHLLGDDAIIRPFETMPDLQPIKRWTEREARQIAINNSSLETSDNNDIFEQ